MKAMILAAGKGTRLQPLTNTKPKALIEVCGISMLEHQVNYLRHYGIKEIIINVHHFADQITDFFSRKNFGCRIEFSDEREELLDTGGGLKKASWFFDDGKPFVLIGSDIFTDLNLDDFISFHKAKNPVASIAVKKRTTTREVLIDDNNFLCGWRNNVTSDEIINRSATSQLNNYGFSVVHIIDPGIFKLMTEDGAFSMIPFYLRICANHPVMAFVHNQSEWYEFGRVQNLEDEVLLTKVDKIIRRFCK